MGHFEYSRHAAWAAVVSGVVLLTLCGTVRASGALEASSICGNGIVEAGEECDPGGVCIGGANAGDACTKEGDCQGQGVCIDGDNAFGACDDNNDCPNSLAGSTSGCIRCRVFGGRAIPDSQNTCAANCTIETDVVFPYIAGVKITSRPPTVQAGTSGAVVHGDPLVIPLPLTGQQTLTIGKEKHGIIPVNIRSDSIQLPRIPIGTSTTSIGCVCVRGVAAKHCGGVVFLKQTRCYGGAKANTACNANSDCPGSVCTRYSPLCTEGFADPVAICPADKKCAFILGERNAGAGFVNCENGPGIPGIDFTVSQDAGGSLGLSTAAVMSRDPNSVGGPGSAFILSVNALAQITPSCTGTAADYGNDHEYCTSDDPPIARGNIPPPAPMTTGNAAGVINNFNGQDGVANGPYSISGAPIMCADLTQSPPFVTAGAGLATAFTQLDAPMLGDIVVTNAFYAAAPSPSVCCQCQGPLCGQPVNDSCGACALVVGSSCNGTTGLCSTPVVSATSTPTPTTTPATATATPTPPIATAPTATPTEAPPTATPTPRCGDGVVDPDEECDPGGVCVGGANAGDACTSESDCQGQGVCAEGDNTFGSCDGTDDCPNSLAGGNSACVRCRAFGGRKIPGSPHTCAANCTIETQVLFPFIPGLKLFTRPPTVLHDTSGAVIHGHPLVIPLPLTGQQTLSLGRERNGIIPINITSEATQLPRIPIGTGTTAIGCDCVRSVAAKRCGGVVFLKEKRCDGGTNANAPCNENSNCPGKKGSTTVDAECTRNSPLCTEGFADAVATCPADKKCAFILGDGNAGAGLVTCDGGPRIRGIDFTISQDAGGTSLASGPATLRRDPNSFAGPGAAIVMAVNAVAQINPTCSGVAADYGSDHEFCTTDDPPRARGNIPPPAPATTGTASGIVRNFNGEDGVDNGPFSIEGVPLNCADLAATPPFITAGAGLATAFTQLDAPMLGDVVITAAFYAAPSPTPGAGDCCQCEQPSLCGPPVNGSCGTCLPIFGASCDGAAGLCASFTATPAPTPTATQPQAATHTPTLAPSSTPRSDLCCQCEGALPVCGPASGDSCGTCTTIFGASCNGQTGRCATLTPTVTPTTTAAQNPTSTANATAIPTQTPSTTSSITPSSTQTDTPTATPTPPPTDTASPTGTPTTCAGDCGRDGVLTADELLRLTSVALGTEPVASCEAADGDKDGRVAITEVVTAVVSARDRCPALQICGGIAGLPCSVGESCEFPEDTCNVADRQGVCQKVPDECPFVVLPVCGCDGVTYANDCGRRQAGVSQRHSGPC